MDNLTKKSVCLYIGNKNLLINLLADAVERARIEGKKQMRTLNRIRKRFNRLCRTSVIFTARVITVLMAILLGLSIIAIDSASLLIEVTCYISLAWCMLVARAKDWFRENEDVNRSKNL